MNLIFSFAGLVSALYSAVSAYLFKFMFDIFLFLVGIFIYNYLAPMFVRRYKYRIQPTKKQAEALNRLFGIRYNIVGTDKRWETMQSEVAEGCML